MSLVQIKIGGFGGQWRNHGRNDFRRGSVDL